MIRVDARTTGGFRSLTESLIRGNHRGDRTGFEQFERNRELYRVQSAKGHRRPVPDQQWAGMLIVMLPNWWTNSNAALRNVGTESAPL